MGSINCMGSHDSAMPSVLKSNDKCLMNYNKNSSVTKASFQPFQIQQPDKNTFKNELNEEKKGTHPKAKLIII